MAQSALSFFVNTSLSQKLVKKRYLSIILKLNLTLTFILLLPAVGFEKSICSLDISILNNMFTQYCYLFSIIIFILYCHNIIKLTYKAIHT